ncbi:MAG: hypothetical protein NT121_07930 [Chloroflexi bacterium]|nr:hypothetical protein [Chloroflexota bacterium]
MRFGVFIFAYLVISYILFIAAPQVDQSLEILMDLILCVGGLFVWMLFFSQFVLPVYRLRDRITVIDRLVTYLLGGHGPAIFVENGQIRSSEGENKKKGPGVTWLDSASTAVLCSAVEFTRTIGPGVHFTKADEYIAATADLHTLTQSIGPESSDQPFTVAKEDINFQKIQERHWETSGTTRDAIEVVATISVTFRIKSVEREGGTRFGFNAANSEKFIRDSITRGVQVDQPVWSPLPAKMAADIWREYLRKVRLSELFEIVDWRTETTLQYLSSLVKNRLSQSEVVLLDDFGRPRLKGVEKDQFNENLFGIFCELIQAGQKEQANDMIQTGPSQEFETLKAMGLEVTGANIKQLIFAPDVEERMINQWTTLWLKNAQKERDQVERDRKLSETAGSDDAMKEFATDAIRELLKKEPVSKPEALKQLVRSTFMGVRRNTTLLKRTNVEQRELAAIFSWLRERESRE